MENMDKFNLKTIIARIKSETPPFWKKMMRLGITIGVIGAALLTAKQQYVMEWLSEDLCEKMIVAGAVATGLSTLPANQHPVQQP